MSCHCDEALAQIYTYLDGELDQGTVARIRAHIEECHPCGGAYAFEERLRTVVRQRLQEEVPEEVVVRLRVLLSRIVS